MILRRMKRISVIQVPPKMTIGLVMDFFNPKLLEGAQAYCAEQELQLDARWSVRGDWIPEKLNWNGVIYGLVDQDEVLERMRGETMPSLDLTSDGGELSLTPDYFVCGQMAASELACSGVKHILIPQLSGRMLDQQFRLGAIEMAEKLGIEYSSATQKVQKSKIIYREVSKALHDSAKPVGICQPHAGIAYSLINELHKNGLRVPEDVALVVIDKDAQQTAALAPVPLTAVELNEWHRGFVAAERVHRMIRGETLMQPHMVIPPHGIHGRASTGHVEKKDPIMAKALCFIHEHYREPIGVPEVAAASGASRRVLEMRFREYLNTSVHEELRRLRIESAKQLLLEDKLSVTDIAQYCGFSSVHYFSGAFKRETGDSPRKFKAGKAGHAKPQLGS